MELGREAENQAWEGIGDGNKSIFLLATTVSCAPSLAKQLNTGLLKSAPAQ